ncbi:MAG: phosphatidate cytidylyltransferase [Alphaproteobacteria bacterium]|nr:phosphatidate cytidylyltransferase [Alphaproteobacteria bacterium]MDA7983106.1 phosphatidate cytidylyltransferase [Alphaproteobacteria bacterium]MDA7989326.1 phosphatidate cytidylyltransferase [Alphaproteobacteria bacterium]MDA8010129.1 phosphatidate cytidylyltransferase [Alphaproteobacteria bacterium]
MTNTRGANGASADSVTAACRFRRRDMPDDLPPRDGDESDSGLEEAPEVLRPVSRSESPRRFVRQSFHFDGGVFRVMSFGVGGDGDGAAEETFAGELRQRGRSIVFPLLWVILFVWLGGFFSTLLAVIFGIVAAVEWRRLVMPSAFGGEVPMGFASGGSGFWLGLGLFMTPILATAQSGVVLALVWLGLVFGVIYWVERYRVPRVRTGRLVLYVCGGLLIGLALVSWVELRGLGGGVLLWIFFVVWAYDSGAWFVGKRVGGLKLAPRVSPGKTWSGLAGGVVVAVVVSVVAAWGFFGADVLGEAVLFGLLTSLAGQLGDLGESGVKRYAGVKDSGRMFPGHGGFLDRVDSLVAALVFWLFLHWLNLGPSWL